MNQGSAEGARTGAVAGAPPATARPERAPVLGLILLVAALAVPYALFGPNFVLDDWWMLRNVHFDGPLAGAGFDLELERGDPTVRAVITRDEAAFLRGPAGCRFDVRKLATCPAPRGLRFPELVG